MMKKFSARSHPVAGAFVFLLLGVFAVFSILMVALSAQLYKDTVARTDAHNERRVAANYLMNTIHAGDAQAAIYTKELDGMPVLVIDWADEAWDDNDIADDEEYDEDEEEEAYIYQTLIYCHGGTLYELLTSSNEPLDPGDGNAICAMRSFSPSVEGSLLTVKYEEEDGTEQVLHVALHAQAKEAVE